MEGFDDTGERGRDFDDGLRGFDGEHRVVGVDPVARFDVPADDFGFGESFAQVWKIEDFHARPPGWRGRRR
jgi:hypothetical protein